MKEAAEQSLTQKEFADLRDRFKPIYDEGVERAKNSTPEELEKRNNAIKEAVENKQNLYEAKIPSLGREFTNHDFEHGNKVFNNSLKIREAFQDPKCWYFNGKHGNDNDCLTPDFKGTSKVMEISALGHDLGTSPRGGVAKGMDGTLKDLNPNFYDEVRKNHPINSASLILQERDYLKEKCGLNDDEVDMVALEAYLHSKSSSDVDALRSKTQLKEACGVLKDLSDKFDGKIRFEGLFADDDALLSRVSADAICLRIADASRSSFPGDRSESGETVVVEGNKLFDCDLIHDREKTGTINLPELEVFNPSSVHLDGENQMDNVFSRAVHAGEQNIIDHNWSVDEAGYLHHAIKVLDPCQAPECTALAIQSIMKEYKTTGSTGFVEFDIEFATPPDGDEADYWEGLARRISTVYANVNLHYEEDPWDR